MHGQLEIDCWLYILMLLGYTCVFVFVLCLSFWFILSFSCVKSWYFLNV